MGAGAARPEDSPYQNKSRDLRRGLNEGGEGRLRATAPTGYDWTGAASALGDTGNAMVDQFARGDREGPIQMELRR